MANIKSAEKQARQAVKRRARNQQTKGAVRTIEKKLRAAIAGKKVDEAKKLLITFSSKIDKAAQKGVIHVRNASRKAGRLAAQVSAIAGK